MDQTESRDARLDLTKAIALSLVLIWHLEPIRIPAADNPTVYSSIFKEALEFFNLQVSLLGVPLFFLVSLYLLFQKIEDRPLVNMRNRLLRVGEVFIFWTICQIVVYYVIESRIQDGLHNVSMPFPIALLVREGGPPLPIVHSSVFYFLFVLLILTLGSTVFFLLRNIRKAFIFLGISVVAASILYFELQANNSVAIPYWRIDNFLIYIPLSYFLVSQEREKLIRYIPFFIAGFILFTAQDIFIRTQGDLHLSAYGRVSIVFGSMALSSLILQFRSFSAGAIFTFLSKYSLGIFATHKYWQLVIVLVFNYFSFSPPKFPLDLRALTEAVLITSLTCSTVYLAARTPLRRYLT